MIPLLDLQRQFQSLEPELSQAVLDFVSSGRYVVPSGAHPAVVALEEGTDALLLALHAMGVGPGDEVITTPYTFIATAEMVSILGATPVFVDIEPDTFNINPALIEAAITPKTKAIVPVHLFGHPAPMAEINAIAKRHGIRVLEDAAQAWGASMQMDGAEKFCGSIGDAGTFSFFPSKNLGACGEGGLITTNDDELAERIRSLRAHGQRRRYVHDLIGYNARLDAIQAVVLNVKLPHADNWNDARRAHAAHYADLLKDLPVQSPIERDGCRHVFHQYTLRLNEDNASLRDAITEKLTQEKIGWAIYYPVPLHRQPVYETLGYGEGSLPEAERASREVFSLPIFPELRSDEVTGVVAAVRRAMNA
jgi:dTDP-4-amino-4,6-dideoxygalactose transaminase